MEEDVYSAELIRDNNCVYCGESTLFGSGRFVNRIPVDDGYGCAACSGMPCDYCEEQIPVDEDVSGPGDAGFYHEDCLTKFNQDNGLK